MKIVTIFGGSEWDEGSSQYREAEKAGAMLANAGIAVVTGGYGGIMEAALKGAAGRDGKRIGVTTNFYKEKEKNRFVGRELRVNSYTDRLMELLDLGDAYIFFPGSTGVLLELSAAWALSVRGAIKARPMVCVGEQFLAMIRAGEPFSGDMKKNSSRIHHVNNAEEAVSFILNGR